MYISPVMSVCLEYIKTWSQDTEILKDLEVKIPYVNSDWNSDTLKY